MEMPQSRFIAFLIDACYFLRHMRVRFGYFKSGVFALCLAACDGGLTPPPQIQPGIGGRVVFKQGTWPSADSLVNLWVFAATIVPSDSSQVFTALLSSPPQIYVYPSLNENLAPFYADSIDFVFPLPPGEYVYVGVLHHFLNEVSVRSLRIVGEYKDPSDPTRRGRVTVTERSFVPGIRIDVDFRNPPPQPF